MNVSFSCRQCDQAARAEVPAGTDGFACPHCQRGYDLNWQGDASGRLATCPVCGCDELYVRKDFSQRIGLTIVVIGFVASSIAWGFHMRFTTYGILFATALIDVALYILVGNLLQCYRCRAEFRGLAGCNEHDAFRLETHERFRQQAARLAEAADGQHDEARTTR